MRGPVRLDRGIGGEIDAAAIVGDIGAGALHRPVGVVLAGPALRQDGLARLLLRLRARIGRAEAIGFVLAVVRGPARSGSSKSKTHANKLALNSTADTARPSDAAASN